MARARFLGTSAASALLLCCVIGVTDLQAQKRYYRGNTHTHSYPNSCDIADSTYTGPNIVSQYKAKGYDFLVFTDHETCWDAAALSTSDFTVIDGCEAAI